MSTAEVTLLQDYVVTGSQQAFSALVTDYVDLVYSAALRQVRSPQLAEEITQSTFIALARNAHRLQPGTPLVAWLYLVTRRAAIDALRAESRRQKREQIAMEMTAMNSASSEWSRLESLLDDAMAALGEHDRAVILLRFFEDKSLREVGDVLGTSEDAAQKRVSRALEQLRVFFSRRGVAVGAASLATSLSAHAVHAAPIGLGLSISSSAAVAGGVIAHGAAAGTTSLFVMTTVQKILVGATLTVAVGVGLREYQLLSQQREQLSTARREVDDLRMQARQLRQERDAATSRWAAMQSEIDVAQAKIASDERAKPRGDSAAEGEMKTVLDRVDELKRRIAEMPGARARASSLLSKEDWIKVALDHRLETDGDIKKALGDIQNQVMGKWAKSLDVALRDYTKANGGVLPSDCAQLASFLPPEIDPAILQRFQMLRTGNLNDLPNGALIMADIGGVDDELNSVVIFGRGSLMIGSDENGDRRAALQAYVNFVQAHSGQTPVEATQLQPYLRRPVDPQQLQDIWRQYGASLR